MRRSEVVTYVLGSCAVVLLILGTMAAPTQLAFAQFGTIVCTNPLDCPNNTAGTCDMRCLGAHCDTMNPNRTCQNDRVQNCSCQP